MEWWTVVGTVIGLGVAWKLFYTWLRQDRQVEACASEAKEDFKVIVVGAGFSGLGMGIKLKKAGIPFVIIEKAPEVGGTWWHNTYRGCACDIPSHLYSFSFEPKCDWSRVYPTQPEILEYLKHCAEKYGLYSHIRLNEEADDVRYDSDSHKWHLVTKSGKKFSGNVLVSAFGGLHVPNYPKIPGFESYKGLYFHTAEWSHAYDPSVHKRIGVVGCAASAVQTIPELQKVSEHVTLFQRTPNWISPRLDAPFGAISRFAFKYVPGYREITRWGYWMRQELAYEIIFKRFGRSTGVLAEKYLRRFINKSVGDKETASGERLADILTPSYPPGCKRVLVSSNYYPSLAQDNVTVVTDSIAAVSPNGIIVTNRETGQEEEHALDAVLYATGFQLLQGFPLLHGKSKRDLMTDVWRDLPTAYLGITAPDFPNMFVLLGPNTGLGHNSVVYMIECQITYIMDCIIDMIEDGIKEIEVKEEKNAAFQEEIQPQLETAVWARSNCTSWYQNAKGTVFALWPGPTYTYWWRTRKSNLREDYNIIE